MWEAFAGDIAKSRGLETERVKALAANLEVSLAEEAEKAGLVDVVCYEDKAVEQMLALGAEESDDHRLNKLSLGEYVAKCGTALSATVDTIIEARIVLLISDMFDFIDLLMCWSLMIVCLSSLSLRMLICERISSSSCDMNVLFSIFCAIFRLTCFSAVPLF